MTEVIIIFTHCPDTSCAHQIAEALITKKLAACVNISAPSASIYRWQGQIEKAQEISLSIKTSKSLFKQVEECIQQLHPYDLPDIYAVGVIGGESNYLQWIADSVAVP